jgi:NAD(P)H-dependent FMN reductase
VRVVTLCGSLQPGSSNRRLLDAARDLAGDDEVVDGPTVDTVGWFVPEADGGPSVAALRAAVAGAGGVLIASPEYAHSLPGSLKNALDWLVGSGELYGKPVAVLCATPRHGGGHLGRAALVQTLRAQGADVRLSASVLVRRGAGDGLDADALDGVRAALDAQRPPPAT